MTKRIKSLLVFFLICPGLKSFAQEYKIKAILGAPTETGFYQILISPDLSAVAKPDFSDIRIMDSNVFVPYIIRKTPEPVFSSSFFIKTKDTFIKQSFKVFPILSNGTDSSYTNIIIENPINGGISNLSLVIRNTAVERYTSLSGSDDKQNWYIIDDHILFHKADSYTYLNGNYLQTISFPLSKYRLFKLKINNAHTDPLNILCAGIYQNADTIVTIPRFQDNPVPTFYQKDSNNDISYIIVQNKAPYLADQVTIDASGPKFFNRHAAAYIVTDNNDSSELANPVSEFTISSNLVSSTQKSTFNIPRQKTSSIIIAIDNKDDPPLKLLSVATSQEKQYLVAWLEKGKTYTLLADNPAATPPRYDLGQFKDSIPNEIKTLSYGALILIPKTVTVATKPSVNYWLWPVIVLSVLVLSFLTYRLMKDVKKNGG